MSHVFFASAMGSQQIGLAFKLTTQSKSILTHLRAFVRTQRLDYILRHSCGMCSIAKKINDAPLKILGSKTHTEA